MTLAYETLWLRYFALTVLVELAVAPALLDARSLPRRLLAVLVANFATHPFVWFFVARLGLARATLTGLAELWALTFEAAVYALVFPSMRPSRALGVSALANGASFLLGALVNAMWRAS